MTSPTDILKFWRLPPQGLNSIGASACVGLIAVALFMQYMMELNPCYLCIVQRVFVITTGFILLIASLHNPGRGGQRVYALFGALSAVSGAGFSIRQLWLQSLPEDKVPACGPSADYLFDSLPLRDALSMLLRGDGNCAEVQWALLDLSIPAWTLLAFTGLALLCVWQGLRRDY